MVAGGKRATPEVLVLNVDAACFPFRTKIGQPVNNPAQGNGKNGKEDMLRVFEIRKNRRLRDRRFVISNCKEALLSGSALVIRNLFGLVAGNAGFAEMRDTDGEYCQE